MPGKQNASIKGNFIFNVILTLSTYIAQLIVYPYVSRVLGVENIGVVGFVNKTIEIFLIFSTLGISTVGVREIAVAKGNKNSLDSVFSSLVSFLIVTTFVVSIVYVLAVLFITKFNVHSDLFYIGLGKLLFSTLLIEWFYQGLEEFRYITIRSVLIKIVYIVLVFIFVKSEADAKIYFLLTVFVVMLNGVINWITSHKYVSFRFSFESSLKYAKDMFVFGTYLMLNATFSTCNYLFLGLICDDKEVGFYYTAESFYFILLSLITAFTRVMLPRMASLLAEDRKEEFNSSIAMSLRIVLSICIPISIFGYTFASPIIYIFSGAGYEGAINPMKILMLLVTINALNQIFIVQVATPLKLDKEILIGTIIGTIVALSSNYFMIKAYGAVGCSLVLVTAVVMANLYPIIYIIKRKLIIINWHECAVLLLKSLPYCAISFVVKHYFDETNQIIQLVIALFIYLSYFYITQQRIIKELINK